MPSTSPSSSSAVIDACIPVHPDSLRSIYLHIFKQPSCVFVKILNSPLWSKVKLGEVSAVSALLAVNNDTSSKETTKPYGIRCLFFTQLHLLGKWINQHECFTHHWALLHAFPGGSVVKNLPANAGNMGSIPGLVRSPGEENAYPLQYSCLGNPTGRGTWRATVHGAAEESDMT